MCCYNFLVLYQRDVSEIFLELCRMVFFHLYYTCKISFEVRHVKKAKGKKKRKNILLGSLF